MLQGSEEDLKQRKTNFPASGTCASVFELRLYSLKSFVGPPENEFICTVGAV